MREILVALLHRIERDERGLAIRLYPFSRRPAATPPALAESPRLVVIDPLVGFGRPVLSGTGVTTLSIAERFDAGESIEDLAADYGRPSRRDRGSHPLRADPRRRVSGPLPSSSSIATSGATPSLRPYGWPAPRSRSTPITSRRMLPTKSGCMKLVDARGSSSLKIKRSGIVVQSSLPSRPPASRRSF